jgi:hypothetical protein
MASIRAGLNKYLYMKKIDFYLLLLLIPFLFASCEPEELNPDLLEGLSPGKMVVVLNDQSQKMMDCVFVNNYAIDFKGEVVISGNNQQTGGTDYLSIEYGSILNEVPMIIKTYSSGISSDQISVKSKFGDTADNGIVDIEITQLSVSGIKGRFEGVLATGTGSTNIRGAFWALPSE